jgi:tRNA threonylcarbamoyl adenosine modification protein YeaZ
MSYELLEETEGPPLSTHSSVLPELVESVFKKRAISVRDLSLIACGRGPGSFTGLRTGLAYAKGLGFGANIVVGVPTLAALAWNPSLSDGIYASSVDARHGEIFVQLFRRLEGELRDLSGILVARPAQICQTIKDSLQEGGHDPSKDPIKLIGPGAALVEALDAGFVKGSLDGPKASTIGVLGIRLNQEDGPEKHPPLPLYGRSPAIFKTWIPPRRLPASS